MQTEPRMADFIGCWCIDRTIDHADGTHARFSGQAILRPNGAGGLDYDEDGALTLPDGGTMRATRAYRWDADLSVFFDDGRPFHQIPAGGGYAVHLCPPDTYHVTYDFQRWPEWRAIWQVAGPRKDYCITTIYRPAD